MNHSRNENLLAIVPRLAIVPAIVWSIPATGV